MTRQEIFNRVKTHLLTQGEKAAENGGCRYRTSDGLKCAYGCLIDDADYYPDMEGKSIKGISNEYYSARLKDGYRLLRATAVKLLSDSDEDIKFLSELQYIHDGNGPEKMERTAQGICSSTQLNLRTDND